MHALNHNLPRNTICVISGDLKAAIRDAEKAVVLDSKNPVCINSLHTQNAFVADFFFLVGCVMHSSPCEKHTRLRKHGGHTGHKMRKLAD
jgi:hypothetical protein